MVGVGGKAADALSRIQAACWFSDVVRMDGRV